MTDTAKEAAERQLCAEIAEMTADIRDRTARLEKAFAAWKGAAGKS